MKKLPQLLPVTISYYLLQFVTARGAFAQSNDGAVDIGTNVSGFFGFKCITEFVFQVVDVAIISSGILLLVYLVYGGIEWLVSSGDKAKVESARAKITNALIGVAIIAASFAIWKVALTFFGIDAPNICSKNPLGLVVNLSRTI